MIHPVHDALLGPALWDAALEKYACVTNLTVQLFDAEGGLVLGPIHQTPLFQLFDEKQYDPGIFLECARCCLVQRDARPAVTVSQAHSLAAVGTSLMLDGRIVGAAVGGYVFADFNQVSDIQGLARHAGIPFARLWDVSRQQSPVPQRRLLVYGELLQVLGDALLRENHRACQYERAAAIIESSDDAIVSQNLDGIITSWNGGAERLFGYPATEAIGRPAAMLMPPPLVDEESGMVTRIRGGESIEHYETVRRRKDGTLLDISLSLSPITDAQGRIAGVSKVSRDITERKRAESALRCLNDELEVRVTERTEELLASQDRLRGLATELNRTEQQERKRLAVELHDHLQQILVLGKLKLGLGKRLAKSLPACAEMISETDAVLSDALKYTHTLVADLSPPVLRDHGLPAGLKWLGEHMKKYNMIVTVTVPEEELMLPEDQVFFLFQSVRELLINSSKHAGTGLAAVTLERRDGRLLIEVSDQGAGFDLAAAAIPQESSSKFGLFTVRERMKSLGGSFDLQSIQGQGTTVLLSLPLGDPPTSPVGHEAPRAPGHEKERSPEVTLGRRRPPADVVQVLLVDDHTMLRQGLRTMLEGYQDVEIVGEAGDGHDAMQAIDRLRPRVVVMDINMPKMNGIDTTAQIKARHPEMIVIGLSVNVDGENREAMMKAGADVLLSKEAAIDQLHQTIYTAAHPTTPCP